MSKLTIQSENPNYLARVIALPAPRKHSNADKLQCISILANNIITGLDAKEGDLYVYFPLECAISSKYLSYTNSYSDSELNKVKTFKGFFPSSGRVKAIKLRGERSEGYIVPISSIIDWASNDINGPSIRESDFEINKDFDTIDGELFVEKYVNKEALRKLQNAERAASRAGKKAKRESKLVENQFRVAEDTRHLKREISNIQPDDVITISYKLHGCNFSMGKVKCKKSLNWYEKLLKKIGIKIDEVHYDLVYASRTVIKNAYADEQKQGFYDSNVWEAIANKYKDCIKDNVVLYGEIVGFTASGAFIQKNYDYKCPEKICEAYIYRGTIVNNNGDVFEMTTPQLQRYCLKLGLKVVPIFYYGKAKDWDNTIVSLDNHWHENFLAKLIEKYNEKDCYMCNNKVPEEGVVVSKEGDFFEAYKLKSFKFLERESKELDSGNVDMDTAEYVEVK